MFVSRLLIPISMTMFSIVFFILALQIDNAPIGNPNAPLYFPLIIAVSLFILSIIYFFEEYKKRDVSLGILYKLKEGRTLKLLFGTLAICLIYSLLFEKVGFIVSSIAFLLAELIFVNGYKKWKTNISVSICFTIVIWYGFSRLLGLSLP